MTEPEADHLTLDRPRGALKLMVDPVFGGIFWGKLLATAGVFVHGIVAAIVVFDATGSAVMVGLVTVAQFAPQLALSPLSGKWADRGHAARQILAGRTLCTIGSGALALWIWLAPPATGHAAAVPVLLASLVVGLGFVLGGPAMNSIVPSLVRPDEMATAMALNVAPSTVGRIAGPALGALVTAHLGAAAGFGLAAATHLVFVLILVAVTIPAQPAQRDDVDYSVRAALRHVRQDRPLLLLLLATATIGVAAEPSATLGPALAERLGGGDALVGWLSTAFGFGAAIGIVVMSLAGRRLGAARASSSGLWLMAAGLAVVTPSTMTVVVLVGFVITGLGFSASMAGVSTLIQERAPSELRGRIMALWMVGFVGARPLAAAGIGLAADLTSVGLAFVGTAVAVAAMAWLCRPRRLRDPAASDAQVQRATISSA